MKLPGNIQKIGIFRALQLGDMLCSIPAARALRAAYPKATIILIGLPWAQAFTKRFNKYFDGFISFPGAPGLPEQEPDEKGMEQFLQKMKTESFDLLFQMQGNGTIVNNLVIHWYAKTIAGFYNNDSSVDSPYFLKYPNRGSEIHRHLALMKHCGIPAQGDYLEFPISEKEILDVNKLLLPLQKCRYVIVHPGSRGSWRQWPVPYFAEVARYCIEQHMTVVITGTANEIDITSELIKRIKQPVIDLTGKTNLGMMAYLIQNAALLVANCTGVSHIASATATPSVVISMDGESERWSPLNKKLHHVIDWTKDQHFETVFKEVVSFINNAPVKPPASAASLSVGAVNQP